MELSLTKHSPIEGVNSIEIFEPKYDDFGNLCYPVHIDELCFTSHKDVNGVWHHKESAILPKKVVRLVSFLIEKSRL